MANFFFLFFQNQFAPTASPSVEFFFLNLAAIY